MGADPLRRTPTAFQLVLNTVPAPETNQKPPDFLLPNSKPPAHRPQIRCVNTLLLGLRLNAQDPPYTPVILERRKKMDNSTMAHHLLESRWQPPLWLHGIARFLLQHSRQVVESRHSLSAMLWLTNLDRQFGLGPHLSHPFLLLLFSCLRPARLCSSQTIQT